MKAEKERNMIRTTLFRLGPTGGRILEILPSSGKTHEPQTLMIENRDWRK